VKVSQRTEMVLQHKVHNNKKKQMLSGHGTVQLGWTTGWEKTSSVVLQLLKKAHLCYVSRKSQKREI